MPSDTDEFAGKVKEESCIYPWTNPTSVNRQSPLILLPLFFVNGNTTLQAEQTPEFYPMLSRLQVSIKDQQTYAIPKTRTSQPQFVTHPWQTGFQPY